MPAAHNARVHNRMKHEIGLHAGSRGSATAVGGRTWHDIAKNEELSSAISVEEKATYPHSVIRARETTSGGLLHQQLPPHRSKGV